MSGKTVFFFQSCESGLTYGNITVTKLLDKINMAKAISEFVCQQCGYKSPQFLGKCPECDSWNTFEEELLGSRKEELRTRKSSTKIINLSDLKNDLFKRLKTGINEFDTVLGGGVVLGSIILIAGDPGIGKSTLLTQIALVISKTLYVAGEESAHQIKIRAERMKAGATFAVLSEVDVDIICGVIKDTKPPLVIIDSIQTLTTDDLSGVAGSVGQVRECAHRLQRLAKENHIPILLVGHVTKDGTVAGPKTLEHLVDVVLNLEGDRETQFRILRGSKNRFGSVDEVGVFEMTEAGMVEVKNPSKLFLNSRLTNTPGSAVAVTLTGQRPILVEIQALVTKSNLPAPRRIGSGIDNSRLQLLTAVLQKRAGLALFDQDIFVNVTGGLRVFEPAIDLAICMAIISSFKDIAISPKTAFAAEVGLLGELRSVRSLEKRIKEAQKLGFDKIIAADNAKSLSQAVALGVDNKA